MYRCVQQEHAVTALWFVFPDVLGAPADDGAVGGVRREPPDPARVPVQSVDALPHADSARRQRTGPE